MQVAVRPISEGVSNELAFVVGSPCGMEVEVRNVTSPHAHAAINRAFSDRRVLEIVIDG